MMNPKIQDLLLRLLLLQTIKTSRNQNPKILTSTTQQQNLSVTQKIQKSFVKTKKLNRGSRKDSQVNGKKLPQLEVQPQLLQMITRIERSQQQRSNWLKRYLPRNVKKPESSKFERKLSKEMEMKMMD